MVGPIRPRTVPNQSIFSLRLLVTGSASTLPAAVSPKCPSEQALLTAASVVNAVGAGPGHTAVAPPFSSEPWLSASGPNSELVRCPDVAAPTPANDAVHIERRAGGSQQRATGGVEQ